MRFVKILIWILLATSVAGCAGGPSDITEPVSYVSPIMYETLDCNQIVEEAKVLSEKTQQISGFSNKDLSNSSVIVWPAGLRVQGNGSAAEQLGKIKFQYEALEKAAEREKCKIQFRRNQNGEENEQKSAQTGWVTRIS